MQDHDKSSCTADKLGPEALLICSSRTSRRMWAVFALSALLLGAGVSANWRIQSDSALYLGIARSLAAGEGYTFSGDPQSSIPPGAPLLYSIVWRAAGTPNAPEGIERLSLWFNALTALVALGGVVAAYFLVREMAGETAAFFAAGLLAVSERYYGPAMAPLTDTLYCLLSWVALFAFVRARRTNGPALVAAASLLIVLAPLGRAVGIALVAALAVQVVWEARRHMPSGHDLVLVLPGLAASAAFIFVIVSGRGGVDFNYWDDLVAGRGAGALLWRFGSHLWTLPSNVFKSVVGLESIAGLSLVFSGWLVWGALGAWRRGARTAVIYVCIYFLWVALGEEVRPRYVAPMLPFIYLFIFEAARLTIARFELRSAAAGLRARRVLHVLLVLTIAANLVYIGSRIHTNHSRDFLQAYRRGRWIDYADLGKYLAQAPPEGRVLVLQHRILHMLSGALTTPLPYHPDAPHRPSQEEMAQYIEKRYVSAIVTDGNDQESLQILTSFIESSQYEWQREAEFGRLVLHRRHLNAQKETHQP